MPSIRVKSGETGVMHEVFAWGHSGFNKNEETHGKIPELQGKDIVKLASGLDHFVAVTSDAEGNHEVWSWGCNSKGQLGNGTLKDSTNPVLITDLQGKFVTKLVCGYRYSIAVCTTKKGEQEVYAWGGNEYGQLGIGGTDSQKRPTRLYGLDGLHIEGMVCGAYFNVVVCSKARGEPHEVFTFGANSSGQLGIGNTTNYHRPVRVPELCGRYYDRVSCGYDFAVAIATEYKGGPSMVVSWGGNGNGELGAGSDIPFSSTPIQIELPAKQVDRLACGVNHTLIVLMDGDRHEVWAWGANQFGQLGVGTTDRQNLPARVNLPAKNVERMICGVSHTIAICNNIEGTDRQVYVWGFNFGQLKKGSSGGHQLIPLRLDELDGKYMEGVLYGDDHTITVSSETPPEWIYIWGGHSNKQLGVGQVRKEPYRISDLPEGYYANAASGAFHTLVVWHNGRGDPYQLYGWGYNNRGQLGNGNIEVQAKPVLISGIAQKYIEMLACGFDHTIAVASDGGGNQQVVYTWGSNVHGQLGTGNILLESQVPAVVTHFAPYRIKWLTCGGYHNLVYTEDAQGLKELWCWGYNEFGQLGNGSIGGVEKTPVKVANLKNKSVDMAACGYNHTVVVLSDKGGPQEVLSWGQNKYGQLGNGDQPPVSGEPVLISFFEGKQIHHLACGANFTVLVCSDGGREAQHEIYTWGQNLYGQLGTGDNENQFTPVKVEGLEGKFVCSVVCGAQHVLLLAAAFPGAKPEVYCWGYNAQSQLGIGNVANQLKPTRINSLLQKKVEKIVAGISHSLAICVELGGAVEEEQPEE